MADTVTASLQPRACASLAPLALTLPSCRFVSVRRLTDPTVAGVLLAQVMLFAQVVGCGKRGACVAACNQSGVSWCYTTIV